MKYNTKLQRKKIYERILKKFETCGDNWEAICVEIQHLANGLFLYEVRQIFIEMMQQKPHGVSEGSLWWDEDDVKIRIKALKAAIKLCETKIKQS